MHLCFKKLNLQSEAVEGVAEINRLYISDIKSRTIFLIDTGADISVLPSSMFDIRQPSSRYLFAANGTRINTFGEKRLKLDLGLRRELEWQFIIADVKVPILGADFLAHFDLLVDVKRNGLVDNKTKLTQCVQFISIQQESPKLFHVSNNFMELLAEFPELLTENRRISEPLKTKIFHYIETKGPPVSSRPRRLTPEKLNAAKEEFAYLMKMGICRPSGSPWPVTFSQEARRFIQTLRRL